MEPGQDPNNLGDQQAPAEVPELNVDLANPGQANSFLNPQIPSSDSIMAPAQPAQPVPPVIPAQPAPDQPMQSAIPPTAPPAEPAKPQIAWERVAIAGAGVIVILALGAYLLLGNKKPTASTPTNTTPQTQQPVAKDLATAKLTQRNADGTADITGGGSYNKGSVTLEFDITNATGSDVIPEVEVQPMGTAFTSTATSKGQAATLASDGTTLHGSVVVPSLADGAYHWQARATQADKSGDWTAYGTDVSAADFTIDTVAPAAPTVATIDSTTVTSGQTVTTTSNRPTLTGKADPNTAIAVEVNPEGIKLTATSDSTGAWSLTANVDVPNGSHTVAVTTTDSAGNTASATVALGINTTTASSPAVAATTTDSTLAKTGQATQGVTFTALLTLVLSLAALAGIKRYARG